MALQNLPNTMRALIHNQKLQNLSLTSMPLPTLHEEGEHLLKVHSVALTKGELLWPRGEALNQVSPGVEMSGAVVTAPPGSRFKQGDEVYMRSIFPSWGSAREYSTGLEAQLALRPRNISGEEAACVPVSALTAYQALFEHGGIPEPRGDDAEKGTETSKTSHTNGEAKTRHEKRVLVTGASGNVGLWMTQLARAAGAHVVGTCSSRNTALVQSMGAHEVIEYDKLSIRDWLSTHSTSDENSTGKFDLILDTVGRATLTQCWAAARPDGLILSIVPPDDMVYKFELERPEGASETIRGKFFIMKPNGEQLGKITTLIEAGIVKPVMDSLWPLEQYEKAFAKVDSGKTLGKVVLRVGREDGAH